MASQDLFNHYTSAGFTVWGSSITVQLPTHNAEIATYVDTKLAKPGQENIHFYDFYIDHDNGSEIELVDDDHNRLTDEEIAEKYGTLDRILCYRRKYINLWGVEIEGSTETFFADFWIVKNQRSGNLYHPENLQNAELQYLKTQVKDRLNSEDDDFDCLFDQNQDDVVYSALNWQQEEISNLLWQRYEEYNEVDKLAEVWLVPLGENHYLKLRIYHMRFSGYKEFQRAFTTFCKTLMNSVQFKPQVTDDLQYISTPKKSECLAHPEDIVKSLGLGEEAKNKWLNIQNKLATGDFDGCTQNVPAQYIEKKTSRSESSLFYLFIAAAVLLFAIWVLGAFGFHAKLTQWLIPQSDLIYAITTLAVIALSPLRHYYEGLKTKLKQQGILN